MPKLNCTAAAARNAILLHAVALGRIPVKAIAADLELSQSYARKVMWEAGYRSMLVTGDEREALLKTRRLWAEYSATSARRPAA